MPEEYLQEGAFLLLQVVMPLRERRGNVGDDVPNWVIKTGMSNPDIYFTDREYRHNTECLSWLIDKVRVLQGDAIVENVCRELD